MNIAIITGDHTQPDPEKHTGTYLEEDLAAHQIMVDAFASFQGINCTVINDHSILLQQFQQNPPDLVVNFCDTGFNNNVALELHIPAFLELLNIPYTGASPAAIATIYDKAIVRLVAQSLNIPAPQEIFLHANAALPNIPLPFPLLIKPNCADGSLGITKDAVVNDMTQAKAYLDWLQKTLPGRDILLQEFLDGEEYGVGIIGNSNSELEALPILEVDYSKLPNGLNRILSYESKAVPTSPYWSSIKYKAATASDEEQNDMIAYAKQLFNRFKLHDYGRFDFRRGHDGVIKLMEANPNPAWAYDGKLAIMAGLGNISYPALLHKIVSAACQRMQLKRLHSLNF